MEKKYFGKNALMFAFIFCIYTHTFLNNGFIIPLSEDGVNGDLGEPRIIGRLIKTKLDGMFSGAGLTGHCITGDMQENWNVYYKTPLQLRLFENQSCPTYLPYYSQSGFQAMAYSFFSGIYERWFGPFLFAKIFNAILLSIVLCFFLAWIHRKFGLFVLFACFILSLTLKWIIIVGDNINLANAFAYLPLVLLLWNYELEKKSTFKLAFVSLFLRYLFSGAEYFTINFAMVFSPLIFYSIENSWSRKKIFTEIKHLLLALILSTLLAALILGVQITLYNRIHYPEPGIANKVDETVNYFSRKMHQRGFGEVNTFLSNQGEPRNIPVTTIMQQYLNINAVNLQFIRLSFTHLIFIFMGATFIAFLKFKNSKNTTLKALAITCWFSITGPLSWIILAKGHSTVHIMFNPLVWDMPFTFFGILLIAATLKAILYVSNGNKK